MVFILVSYNLLQSHNTTDDFKVYCDYRAGIILYFTSFF